MKPSFAFASTFAVAVLVACGGSTISGTDAGTTPKAGEPCTTCTGAAPEGLKLCPGGPSLSAGCLGRADGTCGWDFVDCPVLPDSGPPANDASADAASDARLDAGSACGGRGRPPCATGLFCNFDIAAMCGAADQSGVCTPIPQGCPDLNDPVCGCNGKTYGNACEAAAQGVSVASKGVCPIADGAACGTRGAPGSCASGSFCKRDIAAMCGVADAPGACAKIPLSCNRTFDPVCGCDNMDYTNPCEADRASVSVKSAGACPKL